MQEPVSPWIADANADGRVTISDVLPWCRHAFFAPGDWALWAIDSHAPVVARFLGLGEADYGGLLSAVLSAAAWIGLLVLLLISYRFLWALDRRATNAVAALGRKVPLRLRMLHARLRYRLRRGGRKVARTEPLDYTMEHELDPRELALLQKHAQVKAPYALSLADAAAALGLPKYRVQPILDRLVKLQLLDRSSGGYGEPACVISRSGRALLVFRQLR